MPLDSRRLLYFLRIAEFGSFSRAAVSLGVAQPALSHHIRQLEEELGVQLLVRRPRGVTVTGAGAGLVEHARAILARIDEAEQELRSNAQQISGTVSLGLVTSVATSLTPLLLAEIRRRHPGVRLHIAEGASTSLSEWVRSETLDLALNLEGIAQPKAAPLFSEDLYLVGIPPVLAVLDDAPVAFRDALSRPLILPTRRHSMRLLIEQRAAEQGATVSTVFDVDGSEPTKAAVAAGLGCSILSWAAIHRETAEGRLAAARIIRPSIRRTIVVDTSPKGRSSRAALAVRATMTDIVAGLFHANIWRGLLAVETRSG